MIKRFHIYGAARSFGYWRMTPKLPGWTDWKGVRLYLIRFFFFWHGGDPPTTLDLYAVTFFMFLEIENSIVTWAKTISLKTFHTIFKDLVWEQFCKLKIQ